MARAPKRNARAGPELVTGYGYVEPDVQGLAEGRGWTRPAPVDWREEVRGTGPTPEALAALRRQQERRRNGL